MARLVAERRDLAARAARDRLANMLGLHPRDLGGLEAEVAAAMTDHLNRVNRRIQQLVDEAAADELTGALRRAAGLAALEREVQRARRFGDRRLVVAFLDVDQLKLVNDSGGHAAGDRLLREAARCLKERLRAYDLIIRWGGDEFVCVLPEAGLKSASRALNDVLREFQARTGSTLSVGLAEIEEGEAGLELVSRADAQLLGDRRQRRSTGFAAGQPSRPRRAIVGGLVAAALGLLVAFGLDLALATPGSMWWLPHALADTAQVQLSRSPSQAELDLASTRAQVAASKPPGAVRQAWLRNASLHLEAARHSGADPNRVDQVAQQIKALQR